MNRDKLKILLNFAVFNAMWKLAKWMYKYGHKGITAARAFIYYTRWIFFDKNGLYVKLKKYGLTGIKVFRPLRWKHKVSYFTAKLDGQNVFVKTGGVVDTTERECYAICSAQQNKVLKKHIPTLYMFQNLVVEEMIEGESLKVLRDSEDEKIIAQLFDIYLALKECRILHLDLRPDNFIFTKTGNLVLIDFGYSLVDSTDLYNRIKKTEIATSIIQSLGSDYAPKNGTLDDAYSMLLTMQFVCPSLLQKCPKIWKYMNEDIGNRVVKL